MASIWSDGPARALLHSLFDAAVESARPESAIARWLPSPPRGRCVVIGAGKASAAMAAGLDAHWPETALTGLVVTPHGSAIPAGRIEVIEAAHPVPDRASEIAARRILEMVKGLSSEDLVIALFSGGGSSLMALPAGRMSLGDKQAVNRALLASGATIAEMNVVRKHLSAIKGGRLAAAAAPAKVISLLVSDVPGDDLSAIASGPTIAEHGRIEEAVEIVERYQLDLHQQRMPYLPAATSLLSCPMQTRCILSLHLRRHWPQQPTRRAQSASRRSFWATPSRARREKLLLSWPV
jgi:glycerate 2-kinase